MTAIDKVRSFAESREPDVAVIRDGITYGDARELLHEIDRMRALAEETEKERDSAREELEYAYREDGVLFDAKVDHLEAEHWRDVCRDALLEANRRRRAAREACARICDERAKINAKDLNYLDGIRGEEAEACAAAIRAGGKP